MSKKVYFEHELTSLNQQKKSIDKKYNTLSILRALSFIVFVFGLSILFMNQDRNGILIAGAGFISFLLLVFAHADLVKKRDLLGCRIELFQEYIQRFGDEWKSLPMNGAEYLDANSTVANDLDLFGKASLYQFLCVANTPWGTDELAALLSSKEPEANQIHKHQEALKDLTESNTFSFEFLSLSKLFQKNNKKSNRDLTNSLLSTAENLTPSYSPFMKGLAVILPVLTVLSFIGAYLDLVKPILPFSFVIIQWFLAIINLSKAGSFLSNLSHYRTELEAYEQLLLLLEKQNFKSPYLQEIKNELSKNGGASLGIKKLNQIIGITTFRENFITALIIFGLFMWDYNCLIAFDKWKITYGLNMRNWFHHIGKIEALLSLATISFVKEECCYPTIKEMKSPYINTTNVQHPLINESGSVSNSIELNSKTCIITGSNMSGKTTFLRTLGVNTILFNAGGLVCANRYESSKMAIFTSMRIQDDVSQGVSTFYAELIRIKSMVEYSKLGKPMLILIDEIFRGTNSADRVTGAKATIQKLTKSWVISVVSTHDFELCSLEKEDPTHILNYHFDEYYQNDQIKFDYKIKPGKSTSTNAQYLMKMAGVI